jgi:two-component system sensor histidine kinase VicK
VHSDDMENIVRKAYAEALVTGHYLYEVRIVWPDGSLHWIKTQGIVLFDEDKRPERMLGTVLDITESKRDEIRKNDFIAMASHELKTPLTSLKAYIQLLAKKIPKSEDAFINTALVKAGYQVNKMSDLIYGFLDLSRLEAGKLQVKLQQFDINKLIAETVAETLLVNYGTKIIVNPAELITVNADRDKIGQIISNFLSNAIKYSPKENTIIVSCKIVDNNVQVAVADTGIGIKLKDQAKLFQRFYRVENDKMKNISGFGIGLYLSSEIVQRHKGQIWVESNEDKGSTFYFSLPLP